MHGIYYHTKPAAKRHVQTRGGCPETIGSGQTRA